MTRKNIIQLATKDSCTGCAACVNACHMKCISMVEDREGFFRPKIDKTKCVICHNCERTCSILNYERKQYETGTETYAVTNSDDEIRMQSSSGGFFYALAEWTIEHGGVVFGARWDDNWDVKHDYSEDMDGVKVFLKSKYVQSQIGDTFTLAKNFLLNDRWVLFSGTPCQLGGLRAYLGREYEKLIQVDIVCHGVPSPGVWRWYKKGVMRNEPIVNINFRDKTFGWYDNQRIVFKGINNSYEQEQSDNPFFKAFIYNRIIRLSCYNCLYKGIHRRVDFTLGDYWSVRKYNPEINDDRGVSIVFVHTKKGKDILLKLKNIRHIIIQTDNAIDENPSIIYSPSKDYNRHLFFKVKAFLPFHIAERYLTKDLSWRIVLRKIKTIIKIFT